MSTAGSRRLSCFALKRLSFGAIHSGENNFEELCKSNSAEKEKKGLFSVVKKYGMERRVVHHVGQMQSFSTFDDPRQACGRSRFLHALCF